jgi:Ser/Thr protein kinase RdoA (MazF antagonist)
MTKVFQDRQKALQAIIAQIARLQGRRQPAAEGGQYLIITTADLKAIQEAATKEKAEETGRLLARLAGRGRGFGGRRPAGERPQGGQRRSTGQQQ